MQKMLTPHVRAIGRPPGPAQDDAVDPGQVDGTAAGLRNDLTQLIGKEQVLHRISDLVRYASDASPYRYLPQVVVLPRTIGDVRATLEYCARTGRHATFRAGDRGLLHPELVISATRDEKAGLDDVPAQAYLSANRTCEMGLRQATGRPYESFVFLLEELTRL
jgi:hypothetical protein